MDKFKHKYNPDFYHLKSVEILETVTHEDTLSWYHHPCTQALVNSIEGDLAGIVVMWLGGAYSSEESIDLTSQRTAKARGMAQAADDILDKINRIRKLTLREENSTDGNF